MDRNHEVKKGEAGGGDFVGELDGWVERGNKVYETKKFLFGTGSDAKAVVYEPAVENWERAGVLLEDLFLQQADEEAESRLGNWCRVVSLLPVIPSAFSGIATSTPPNLTATCR